MWQRRSTVPAAARPAVAVGARLAAERHRHSRLPCSASPAHLSAKTAEYLQHQAAQTHPKECIKSQWSTTGPSTVQVDRIQVPAAGETPSARLAPPGCTHHMVLGAIYRTIEDVQAVSFHLASQCAMQAFQGPRWRGPRPQHQPWQHWHWWQVGTPWHMHIAGVSFLDRCVLFGTLCVCRAGVHRTGPHAEDYAVAGFSTPPMSPNAFAASPVHAGECGR